MEVIAFLEEPAVVGRILEHLGLPDELLPEVKAQAPPVTVELFEDRTEPDVVDAPGVDGGAVPTVAPRTGFQRSIPARDGGSGDGGARGSGHTVSESRPVLPFHAAPATSPTLSASVQLSTG
jgi:hypothetical protein